MIVKSFVGRVDSGWSGVGTMSPPTFLLSAKLLTLGWISSIESNYPLVKVKSEDKTFVAKKRKLELKNSIRYGGSTAL